MAVRIGDTLKQLNNADFPIVEATDVAFSSGDSLQKLYDEGGLGGDDSTILTEQEYNELPEEEKIKGTFYLYDTGKIFKNSVQYGVTEPVELTYQEYSDMKKQGLIDPDQEYIITSDEQGILLEASDIGYSNAVSNLSCTTVQGAIDKVNDKVDNLIDDEVSDSTVWSSQKTSDEIAKVETELKGNIEELSSNLGELKYGEIVGGKNLVNIIDYESKAENNYTYKFIPYKFELGKKYTISGNCERVSGITNKLLTITLYNSLGSVSDLQGSDVSFASGKFSKTFTINENNINANSILIYTGTSGATLGNDYKFSNIQLEEGTIATEYEPYIPSVKMLADEVSAQNASLGG